jgi:folate-dependent phosphoribosylglycinamide formyltransferase PurN
MRITLFTSDSLRHNYLINLLSGISDNLFVIQECKSKEYINTPQQSHLKQKYFKKVENAEKRIFPHIKTKKINNILFKKIQYGKINELKKLDLNQYLKSDLYIVFGSSFIKGQLVKYLIKKRTINIHAGISPYYRGTDCNFWALYDDNPHLVGATIHLLSEGLDDGPILFHALSSYKKSPNLYTMSTLKSAFVALKKKILNKEIFRIIETPQNKLIEIRYTQKKDFNDIVLANFLKKKVKLFNKKFNKSLLINPSFLKKI